jgi:hypothetical protein
MYHIWTFLTNNAESFKDKRNQRSQSPDGDTIQGRRNVFKAELMNVAAVEYRVAIAGEDCYFMAICALQFLKIRNHHGVATKRGRIFLGDVEDPHCGPLLTLRVAHTTVSDLCLNGLHAGVNSAVRRHALVFAAFIASPVYRCGPRSRPRGSPGSCRPKIVRCGRASEPSASCASRRAFDVALQGADRGFGNFSGLDRTVDYQCTS